VRHIYRRPFDYSQHRQEFNLWALQAQLEAGTATASLTTYGATITGTAPIPTQLSRSMRFSSAGVYRNRWPYAQINARVFLIYTDSESISAERATGAFATYSSTVQLGSTSGATINAGVASGTFATFDATITGGRRDPLEDAVGSLQTYVAEVTRIAGLGVSRSGHVSVASTGPYTRGSSRGRPARRPPPPIGTITKLK
jgi:hypothetical protein